MPQPTFSEYLEVLRTLFTRCQQAHADKPCRGAPYTYSQVSLILLFAVMTVRHKYGAKAQRQWLVTHPEACVQFGLPGVPSRWTLRRRWQQMYTTVQAFVVFLGQWARDLDPDCDGTDQCIDKSLWKAAGPVWHQSDREVGRMPEGLRTLDTEATWSKSTYHGWVYGDGGHWITTRGAFPLAVEVEPASVSEATSIDRQADAIWDDAPPTMTGDNSSCNLHRVRTWARQGVVLITSALTVTTDSPQGGPSKAYVAQPENQGLLQTRGTATEPLFHLIAQLIGTGDMQKQLPLQGLANVRTCLALGTVLAHLAMIVNSSWGLPLHEISHMMATFT